MFPQSHAPGPPITLSRTPVWFGIRSAKEIEAAGGVSYLSHTVDGQLWQCRSVTPAPLGKACLMGVGSYFTRPSHTFLSFPYLWNTGCVQRKRAFPTAKIPIWLGTRAAARLPLELLACRAFACSCPGTMAEASMRKIRGRLGPGASSYQIPERISCAFRHGAGKKGFPAGFIS